jgi:hypothetical protein
LTAPSFDPPGQGICSIAQAGAWDVDGCGLQYIEDASLASKIRAKVNNM